MKNSDQPAFYQPQIDFEESADKGYNVICYQYNGLTKREYFAGLILQGMLSGMEPAVNYMRHFAEISVMQADALLTELEKETTNQPQGANEQP